MNGLLLVVVVAIFWFVIVYFFISKKKKSVNTSENTDFDIMVIPRTGVVENFLESRRVAFERQAKVDEQILMCASDNIEEFISMDDFLQGYKPNLSDSENDSIDNDLLDSVPFINDELIDEPIDFENFELSFE